MRHFRLTSVQAVGGAEIGNRRFSRKLWQVRERLFFSLRRSSLGSSGKSPGKIAASVSPSKISPAIASAAKGTPRTQGSCCRPRRTIASRVARIAARATTSTCAPANSAFAVARWVERLSINFQSVVTRVMEMIRLSGSQKIFSMRGRSSVLISVFRPVWKQSSTWSSACSRSSSASGPALIAAKVSTNTICRSSRAK